MSLDRGRIGGRAAPQARATAVGIHATAYYLGGAAGGILPAINWQQAGSPGCAAMVAVPQLPVPGIALACWRKTRPA